MYKKLFVGYLMVFVTVTTVLRRETNAAAAPSAETNGTNTTTTTTTTTPASNVKPEECNLQYGSKSEMDLLERINKNLKNTTYEWEDTDHKYYFTVCSSTLKTRDLWAGFVQINKQNNNTFVLGRLDDVDVEGFDNIIRLTYNNGDKYARACKGNSRSAVIYIVCDPNQTKNDEFTMIEENNERDKQSGCAYIFKLKTSKTCEATGPTTPATGSTTASARISSTTSSLSSTTTALNKLSKKIGAIPIILIILTCLIASYFIIGVSYLRFVKRARGWEQVPNHNVWQTMTNRIGECCGNTCRFGNRTTQVHSYENINDRISDDENLLN